MNIDHIRAVIARLNTHDKIALTGGSYVTAGISDANVYPTKLSDELESFYTPRISTLALGCSFNPSFCAAVSKDHAAYAIAGGNAFAGVIGCGLIRSPFELDGSEFFSEDAFLTKTLLAAYTDNSRLPYIFSKPLGQGAFHDRIIGERALEELWLYPLRANIKNVGAILLDTGKLNGTNTVSREYVTRVTGGKSIPVLSDYLDADDEAAGVNAGVYMLGESAAQKKRLSERVRLGSLEASVLSRSIEPIVATVARAANFYKTKQAKPDYAERPYVKLTTVLLKNQGALPLPKENVRFVGEAMLMENSRYLDREIMSVKGALKCNDGKLNVLFMDGSCEYTQKAMDDFCALASSQRVVCVILNAPMPLPFLDDLDALLFVPYAGDAEELADILLGREPCGRLPFTWAKQAKDYPKYADARFTGEFRYEDVYNGYRYFENFGKDKAFAFGSGLSYANLDYTDFKLVNENGTIRARAIVRNLSEEQEGSAVLMMFVTYKGDAPYGIAKRLAAFTRVDVDGGKEGVASLTATPEEFAFYDTKTGTFQRAAGKYLVEIGTAADNILFTAEVKIAGAKFKPEYPSYSVSSKFMPTNIDVESVVGRKFTDVPKLPHTDPNDKRVKKLIKRVTAHCTLFDVNRKRFAVSKIPIEKFD